MYSGQTHIAKLLTSQQMPFSVVCLDNATDRTMFVKLDKATVKNISEQSWPKEGTCENWFQCAEHVLLQVAPFTNMD